MVGHHLIEFANAPGASLQSRLHQQSEQPRESDNNNKNAAAVVMEARSQNVSRSLLLSDSE